ncbi:DUF2188 domain-containing protein [Shouchella clausii]|uniref:DUF2188 domain-containing protein n=1 Tax=Shouchella clausii TaxID=79880 RepID=UPI0009E5552A|nr:DUF2188 domain-containing protein [Shouchella clausii]
MSRNQHVTPKNEWQVKGTGNERATSLHDTQKEAIGAVRNIARNQNSELFILCQLMS